MESPKKPMSYGKRKAGSPRDNCWANNARDTHMPIATSSSQNHTHDKSCEGGCGALTLQSLNFPPPESQANHLHVNPTCSDACCSVEPFHRQDQCLLGVGRQFDITALHSNDIDWEGLKEEDRAAQGK